MSGNSVVFVYSNVTDYLGLMDSLGTDSEVVVPGGQSDGVDQMAAYLQGRGGLDAIQVISHGSVGALVLRSTVLNGGNLAS